MGKALTMRGYTLNKLPADPQFWPSAGDDQSSGLEEDGALMPTIARKFKFDDIIEAQRYMKSNKHIGKIVVV